MSLVFGNFCFDYYSNRSWLGLGLELELRVEFLGFIMKRLRTQNVRQAFSLIINMKLKKNYVIYVRIWLRNNIGGHKFVNNEANFFINSLIRYNFFFMLTD